MLGYLLLFVALVLYYIKRVRYISLFLYISFMLGSYGGFNLWTDQILGAKNMDLALIYTFVINISFILTSSNPLDPLKGRSTPWIVCYEVLLVFLLCSVIFSYVHYNFTPFQILQGGRSYLLLLSLPILIRVKPYELQKILELCLWITVLTSILYILQIVVGRPLMPYPYDVSKDPSTGLVRLYNSPALLTFFLIASFVCPRFFPGNINIYRILFITTLICTLGRTGIITTLFGIILATMMMGKSPRIIKVIVILGILILPFQDMLTERFEKGGTANDINSVMGGAATSYSGGEGTMTYRMAWIYERYTYLKARPLGERIFGLGLISGSQAKVYKMYHFQIGLQTENGEISQLTTPDTSYGNLLSQLGFVGMFIYLAFCVSMAVFLYKNRKKFPMALICAAHIGILLIGSIGSSALSEPRYFIFYFLAMAMLDKRFMNQRLLNRNSKWLLMKNNI